MTFNVLVAEPGDQAWALIANGIRQVRPEASILRVKDGEQTVRFLFYRGLFTEAPETPNLVVLAGDLPSIPTEEIVARLRQHPRTETTPVIIVGRELHDTQVLKSFEYRRWLDRQQSLIAVTTNDIQSEVAEALQRLCEPGSQTTQATMANISI